MLIAAVLTAATLAAQGGATGGGQGSASGIQVRITRFWLPETRKTSVLAMVDVPYAVTTPVGTGAAAYIAYQVTARVLDDHGDTLETQSWPRHASAILRAENASGMEQLAFGVAPGKYHLDVTVTDSATGKVLNEETSFDGFASAPEASDLLLANRLRPVSAGDTATDIGEYARGNYRAMTAPVVHIDIAQPILGFMLEAYTADSTTASLALKVATADGSDIVPLLPATRSIPAGGGIIASQFSLEGLPPGNYILKASLTMNGKTEERQAPFLVNQVETALAREVTETNAGRGLDEVYFNSLPEDSLDAEAEELELVPGVTRRELEPYKRDELSLAAKRRFLIEFWAKRDANKATPENETRLAFYNAIGYANAHYSQRYTPGWKTALGRIYTKYGVPTDSLTNPMAGRGKVTYLVWRMSRGKDRWFIFGDRTNNGNYVLLRSNEQTEPSYPGWRELMDPEQVHYIATWLGLPSTYFDYDN